MDGARRLAESEWPWGKQREAKETWLQRRNRSECQRVERFSRKTQRPGGSWSTPGRKKLVVTGGRDDAGVLRAIS